MDSPDNNKIIASSSSTESPVVQESPFFDYLRTLSPIKPARTVAHAFSELSIPSPLPVFTSPRLNPQSSTNFLKTSTHSQSSNARYCRGQTLAADIDVSERPINQLAFGLTRCTELRVTESSPQVQPSSPSGLLDEYLADTVEVSTGKLPDPASSCSDQVDDTSEVTQSMRSKENTCNVDNDNGKVMKYVETKSDMQIAYSKKNGDKLLGKSLALKSGNIKDGEKQSAECSGLMSERFNDISISNSSVKPPGKQNVLHTVTQNAECEQEGSQDKYTQVCPEILQTGKQTGLSQESVENKSTNLEEAGQHQRGTLRRCLQFEASTGHINSISSNHEFSNPANIRRCSVVPANPTDLEILESPESVLVTSSNDCTIGSSLPSKLILCSAKARETHADKIDRSIQIVGNPLSKVPMPSGIGLHLNSIVSTAAMSNRILSILSTENEHPTAHTQKTPSVMNLHLLEESRCSSLPTTVVGKSLAKNHGGQEETVSIVAENSSISQFHYDSVDKLQESNQMSTKNPRKRTYTVEDEGCKRCNCRRSKCLKLYCECFAAGIYCAEPCACQECFNKPEYEDMVLGTRKQIESRNPLAFAPKILRRSTDSPSNTREGNNKVTPSSARHKRGCNCKKSMCLKKYCECYQAGVGCSAGCRCEGCKNSFGIKEGYGEISGVLPRKVDEESWEDLSDGKLVMESSSNFIHSEQHHQPHNLTPLTPSFQSSNHKKDEPKSWLPGRRCVPSPESGNNILSYTQSPNSPRNLNTCDRRGRISERNVDIVFDQGLEFNTTAGMDQFSPRWDGFEDICSVSPLNHFSSRSATMSSPSSIKDSAKVSRVQLQGSVRLSGSLRWRSSPTTPMPRLGGSKLRQESDSEIGYEIMEDDTPDILKEAHTPLKTVTSSSPNHKRVSPPQGHLQSLRSGPSPGLRSGRKFVLQSISSFPSLTPYSDPIDSDSNK